jgi:rod shape-determining protein MreD
MPRIIFAILLMLLALLQTTVLPMGHVIGLTPDLVLVCLLLWSATREPREGLVWAFGSGLFLDLLTLAPLGSTALALLPVVIIGWLSRSRFFQSGLLFPLLMTMAATLAHGAALLLLAPLTGSHLNVVAAVRLALLGAFLNAVLVPPFYLIVQLLDRWIGRNETYARA